MLESTYIHCPGIGPKTERRFWARGARTWMDFQVCRDSLCLSASQRLKVEPIVVESLARLAAEDYAWFAELLPPREHWRAYPAFRDRIAYLDIETTGGMEGDYVTLVGVYDGSSLHQFLRGRNLQDFPAFMQDRALIVTFFGSGFDLPFLRRTFGMQFPQLHVDLCFLLKRLGYSGGLKQVERDLGIARSTRTSGLDGWDAVRLWWEWKRRETREALELLLEYNAEDVLNMERLLGIAYPLMLARTMEGMGD